MSTNIQNTSPYLRTTRNFPTESQPLSVEISKAYLDIASSVNSRSIGIFANSPTITGNNWFTSGASSKQQTLRKIFTFTAAGNIAHGINVATTGGFVSIYGTFTDGSVWYPLPYVDAAAANNQIALKVTSTNIVITAGGGSPPSITKGFVVLEWLSQT